MIGIGPGIGARAQAAIGNQVQNPLLKMRGGSFESKRKFFQLSGFKNLEGPILAAQKDEMFKGMRQTVIIMGFCG